MIYDYSNYLSVMKIVNHIGFEISGHALSDVYGRDFVCAGASAVAFGAVNAIAQITGITPEIEQGKKVVT